MSSKRNGKGKGKAFDNIIKQKNAGISQPDLVG
jgi:hypothetical protein